MPPQHECEMMGVLCAPVVRPCIMDLIKMPPPVYPLTHDDVEKSVGGSTAAEAKKNTRERARGLVPSKLAERAAELKKLRAQKRRNAVACAAVAAW
jgi:hypothetical protein